MKTQIITTFVGSANNNSITKEIVNKIVQELSDKLKNDVTINQYDGHNLMSQCQGCRNCFITNQCFLDKTDDMDKLKRDYLKSDIIIWGSPVYANNISGSFKCMIDRISYWCHEFRFAKKRAIAVITTDNSGGSECLNYLYEILSFLGASDIQTVLYQKKSDTEYVLQKNITNITDAISYNINNNKKQIINNFSEKAFQNFKNMYRKQVNDSIEKQYWIETGLLESKTLYDYVNNKFISFNYFTK
ncbi:flavodoxin family protein [Thomasclavelia sp.]|uniref:flavodoxin family protein n=1 Tax=Thomasclavelia sp. TaxID=3025757 RepID=UPI0025F3CFBE|nr:flavodoxin family protein [Thomasclavelia sp.]